MNSLGKRVASSAALIGCLMLSGTALAQGFEIGGRVGYGIPMGEAADESDLSDAISGQFPLTLDVGYRAIEPLFIGIYLGYGFGIQGSELEETCEMFGRECSISTFDFGLQAQYHLAPGSGTDFWFGGGLGYETLDATEEGSGVTIDTTFSAMPQIMLQLGVDFGSDPRAGFGPFLRFTHATFSEFSGECDGSGCPESITETDIDDDFQAGHQWLTLGFRGTFVL